MRGTQTGICEGHGSPNGEQQWLQASDLQSTVDIVNLAAKTNEDRPSRAIGTVGVPMSAPLGLEQPRTEVLRR
jgi:hypothetical protein